MGSLQYGTDAHRSARQAPAMTPTADAIATALERVLASPAFARATRLRAMLRYLVEASAAGRIERLNETSVALDVFQRPAASFDSARDPIVRVSANRLRSALARHSARDGAGAALRFEIPPGSYVVLFRRRDEPTAGEARARVLVEHARVLNMTQSSPNFVLAETMAAEATQTAPRLADAWFTLAMVRYSLRADGAARREVALEDVAVPLDRALELDPRHAPALSLLAYVTVLRDWDWAQGLALAERAAAIEPPQGGVLGRLAHLQLGAGATEAAIATFRQGVEYAPLAPPAHTALAAALAGAGGFDAALAVLAAAESQLGRQPVFDWACAELLMATGQFDAAEARIEALQTSGSGVVAWCFAAYLAGLRGRTRVARRLLADMTPRLSPVQRPTVALIVEACCDDVDAALRHGRAMLALRPPQCIQIPAAPLLAPFWRDARSRELLSEMRHPRAEPAAAAV